MSLKWHSARRKKGVRDQTSSVLVDGMGAYFFLYSFMDYVDTDLMKYIKAPGSFGAEGRWRGRLGSFWVRCFSVPLAVQQCPLKDVNSAVSAGGFGAQ